MSAQKLAPSARRTTSGSRDCRARRGPSARCRRRRGLHRYVRQAHAVLQPHPQSGPRRRRARRRVVGARDAQVRRERGPDARGRARRVPAVRSVHGQPPGGGAGQGRSARAAGRPGGRPGQHARPDPKGRRRLAGTSGCGTSTSRRCWTAGASATCADSPRCCSRFTDDYDRTVRVCSPTGRSAAAEEEYLMSATAARAADARRTGRVDPPADHDDPDRADARHVPRRARPDDRLDGDPHDRRRPATASSSRPG